MATEVWKQVVGWSKYEVSNLGRVRRLSGLDARDKYFVEGRVLKPVPVKSGSLDTYKPLCVSLSDGPRCKYYKVAKLVLLAFRGPPPDKEHNCVRHLDDDQANNKLINLFWGSQKQNALDRSKNGLTCRGEANNKAVLCEKEVREIRVLYRWHSREFGTVALARKYNVTSTTVWNIVHRQIWNHIQ